MTSFSYGGRWLLHRTPVAQRLRVCGGQAQAHMQAAAAQWGQMQGAYLASGMASGISGGLAAAPMWPFAMGPGYGMGGLPPTPWGPMGQMPRCRPLPRLALDWP